DHPSTARFITTKLYREIVGLDPPRATVDRLAKAFRANYEIMPLVESIAHDDAFVDDTAVRVKYRTPIEKLVGIVQATGQDVVLGPGARRAVRGGRGGAAVGEALRTMSFLPVLPPDVGGRPARPR